MADEIIIDVQVNTDEVQQKLSAAIKELGDLRKEQKSLTESIKAGNDASGEQAKQLASVQAEMQKQQAVIKSSTAALRLYLTARGLGWDCSGIATRRWVLWRLGVQAVRFPRGFTKLSSNGHATRVCSLARRRSEALLRISLPERLQWRERSGTEYRLMCTVRPQRRRVTQ